jgi:hypothetical protein
MVGDTPYDALSAKRAGVVTLGVLSSGLGFDAHALVRPGAGAPTTTSTTCAASSTTRSASRRRARRGSPRRCSSG